MAPLVWVQSTELHWTVILTALLVPLTDGGAADGAIECIRLEVKGQSNGFYSPACIVIAVAVLLTVSLGILELDAVIAILYLLSSCSPVTL